MFAKWHISFKCWLSKYVFKGTFGYTLMLRFCSLETTGLWGVAWQALSLGLASIFLSVNHSKDTLTNDIFLQLFIILVISSRLGLWIFGISVIQLQQQETPEKYRCLVGGVQESLNALLNMIANGIGLIFTHPDDFVYISTSGFISVTLAFFFFFLGIFLPRRNATRELQTCNNGKNWTRCWCRPKRGCWYSCIPFLYLNKKLILQCRLCTSE